MRGPIVFGQFVPCLQNMPNNSHAVLPATAHFEGRVVDKSFTLEKFLDGTDYHGRFATHFSGTPAIAEICLKQSSSQIEPIEVWRKIQALNHPSLLKIFAAGTSEWPDLPFAYMVTEAPAEILAEVLKDRPLDPSEAKEVLDSLLRGLDALHGTGLVHGAVNPQNIVATDTAVKLTLTPIRPAEDERAAAFDIWSAGRTMFQLLKQRLPSDQYFFEVSTLPAPFSTMVLRCLEEDPKQRWTAADLLGLLNENTGKHPPAAADVINEIPAPAKQESSIKPVEAKTSYEPHPVSQQKIDSARYLPKLVIAAIALLVVALTIFLLSRSRSAPAASSQHTAPAAVAPPVTATQPDHPAPAAVSPTGQPQPNIVENSGNWRVIAFTYNSAPAAQHKADSLNERDHELDAQVFSPQPGRYLVSLGGWMSREDATRLRDKARSHGLPRDIYTQNFHR
ncbi:MAG TPA: SPOR domain-containing protein [Bryobacteraceae bacterium]|nr:SPOR domain-containing protein [Bryobacteraceae bacterium]